MSRIQMAAHIWLIVLLFAASHAQLLNVGSTLLGGSQGNAPPGTVAQVGGCTGGLVSVCVAGICSCVLPGSSGTGDPVLRDYADKKFEFFGEPNAFYNLYSDSLHQVNMKLFPGFVDGHNGTYMSQFGIAFSDFRVDVMLAPGDDISVSSWQEKEDHITMTSFASSEPLTYAVGNVDGSELTVKTEPYRPWSGRTVVVTTGTLRLSIWVVPAGTLDSKNVSQPAYLNFNMTQLAVPAGSTAEGIIGESLETVLKQHKDKLQNVFANPKTVASDEGSDALPVFNGKGLTNDYKVESLFGTDFAFNKFRVKSAWIVARRAMMTSPFSVIKFPLHASS